MITINETFNILSNNSPYIYNWSFNKDCVTVGQATGTATTSISATFSCEDGCFPFIATLQLIDKNGCISNIPYTYNSPCTSFTLSSISQTGPLSYIVTSTGQGVTYEWVYDTNLFTAFIDQNTINLTLKPGQYIPVEGHTIFVKATNVNRCVKEATKTFTYEIPVAINFVHGLSVCKENGWQTTYFDLQVASITALNYDSVVFNLPAGVQVQKQGNKFRFTGTILNSGITYNIPYSIENVNGIRSNTAVITFNVPICNPLVITQTPVIKAV